MKKDDVQILITCIITIVVCIVCFIFAYQILQIPSISMISEKIAIIFIIIDFVLIGIVVSLMISIVRKPKKSK